MHCQSCGADLPDDARFCIECGAQISAPASTGATVQLPRPTESSLVCPACGAVNPGYAVFCVQCGEAVGAAAGGIRPGGSPSAQRPQSVARHVAPPAYTYRRRQRRRRGWEGATGAIFLIGLAALFLLKLPLWPGILILVGLVAFASEAMRGRYLRGLGSVLWLFGLAFLFMVPRLLWPGILVLAGLSMLLELARRRLQWP